MDAVMVENKGGGKARRKECLPQSPNQWTFGDCAVDVHGPGVALASGSDKGGG